MNTTLSAKLKLTLSADQFRALRATQLAYRDALNWVSRHAFAQGKISNQQRLQRETYDEVRAQFGLPAQMACNVPRQVGATYKGLWTKVRQNAEARRLGATSKRYKGLDKPPRYASPTLTYNYHRDYSLKDGQQVSILTLQGALSSPIRAITNTSPSCSTGPLSARPNSGTTEARSASICSLPWNWRRLPQSQRSTRRCWG